MFSRPEEVYLLADPTDVACDRVPIPLYLVIPGRPVTPVSPQRRLPARKHFARKWWVMWARDEIAAGLQVEAWINQRHRHQVELDTFAAHYRAGDVEEVWRLLKGFKVRSGQLIDPLVADAMDALRASAFGRNPSACDSITQRQWLARARERAGRIPMLGATRRFLESAWTQIEEEATAMGTLDLPMDVPGPIAARDQVFIDTILADVLTPEIRHRVRNRGGLA